MECGHEKTCVVPVVNGKMKKDWSYVTDIAGHSVQDFLEKICFDTEHYKDSNANSKYFSRHFYKPNIY